MADSIDKIFVRGKEYDIRHDLDLALDESIFRMQGRGSEHDNVFDPFYYKEFSNGDQAYADVRTWLDGLHSTVGGANPLSFLRLFVNGAWLYVLQNGLSYAQDVHSQTILNGTLMLDGGIRPGKDIYMRISKPLADRTSTTDIWEPWRKLYDQSDINYFYDNVIVGNYAPLADGKVPAANLPSYVDDVLEYASISSFPSEGEEGKIYLAIDTNKQYRWSGTQYSEVSPTLALGETSSTAFAGNRGKALETAQATLAASVASAVNSVNTLSSTVNGKAAQADVTALAVRVTSAENDIDDLETAIEDMATKSGDNTFSGNNTFTGDTTVYDAAINLLPTPPSDPDEDPDLSEPTLNITRQKISMGGGDLQDYKSTEITHNSVKSSNFYKMVVDSQTGLTPKALATVEEMNTALATKASTDALQTEVLRAQTAEQALSLAMAGKAATVELTNYLTQGSILPWAGVYLYSGRPISHLRVTQDGPTSYSIVFCVEHIDAMEHIGTEYHLYTTGDSAEGWTYVNSYDDETVPDYILRLFGENEATTQYPGRMSNNDKSHLDTLWSERGGGGGSDTFATLFAALTSEGGVIRIGDNFMDFNSYNEVSWGVLKSLLLNTNTEGSVHEIVDNHYTNRDTNYLENEVYSDDEDFSLAEMSNAFECQGSDVIVKSGHSLYAVVLNIQPSSPITLNIADEDNIQSITVTLDNTATFTEVVLDYGNTPLASSKKIYITDANGNDLEIMLQPTIKFLPS